MAHEGHHDQLGEKVKVEVNERTHFILEELVQCCSLPPEVCDVSGYSLLAEVDCI
jgi:hypothetical protein